MDVPIQIEGPRELFERGGVRRFPRKDTRQGSAPAPAPVLPQAPALLLLPLPLLPLPLKPSPNVAGAAALRKRSNSRSQGNATVALPSATAAAAAAAATITLPREYPERRPQVQYVVSLSPLNGTFIRKSLLVPFYPETLKLGRPAGSKVKPEISNGYFDSRVLSRNHAAMYIDPSLGKLKIKDLGLSNGTFVNELKIGQDAVELKIGDTIYLGFNIEVDTNHKKISAKVDDITVMPTSALATSSLMAAEPQAGLRGRELVQYNAIKSLFEQDSTLQQPLFENALFGDINPALEDSLMGLTPKTGCGIFSNSHITNAAALDQTMQILANNLMKARQQNLTLKSVESFLRRYRVRLNEINEEHIERQIALRLQKFEEQIDQSAATGRQVQHDFERYRAEKEQTVLRLELQVARLQMETDNLQMQLKVSEHALHRLKMERKRAEAATATAEAAAAKTKTAPVGPSADPTVAELASAASTTTTETPANESPATTNAPTEQARDAPSSTEAVPKASEAVEATTSGDVAPPVPLAHMLAVASHKEEKANFRAIALVSVSVMVLCVLISYRF